MDRLYDKLLRYSTENYYPMHMPGHKRNIDIMTMINPYALDITEIEGFDNLHQSEGILKRLSEDLSKTYKSKKSYPLVNGSTSGILAGISALTNKKDQVLIARNCHKSVYHAVALRELKPIYIYPERVDKTPVLGGILPRQIEELLIKHPKVKLVVITSPTYEGVVSDIKTIAEVAHRFGAYLLVDEAHGAHFGFHPKAPKSAVICEADLVIQSLHKTLPAFTQTAILHSNCPEIDKKIKDYLAIYQSSSPSYLLMAGIDRCLMLLEDQSPELFQSYYNRLENFYRSMKTLKNLRLLNNSIIGGNGVYDFDLSKITILVPDNKLNGNQLFDKLYSNYHIVMELEASNYVLGLTSICDTEEGFQRLAEALLQIDEELTGADLLIKNSPMKLIQPEQVLSPYEAMEQKTEMVLLSKSLNRISAAYVSFFPPGVPILVPGEKIEKSFIDSMKSAIEDGLTVTGLIGDKKDRIEVIAAD